MKVFKQLEQLIFSASYRFQDWNMQDRAFFLIVSFLSQFSKLIFIMIFFLYETESVIRFSTSDTIRRNSMVLSIILFCEAIIKLSSFILSGYISFEQGFKINAWKYYIQVVTSFMPLTMFTLIILIDENLQKQQIILTSINFVTFFVQILMFLCRELLSFTHCLVVTNLFKKKYSKNAILSNILSLMLLIYLSSKTIKSLLNPAELTFYTLFVLALCLIKLKQTAIRRFFVDKFSQKVNNILVMIELSFCLITTWLNLINMQILRDYYFLMVAVISVFSIKCLFTYNQNQIQETYLMTVNHLKNMTEAKLHLDILAYFADKIQKQEESMMFTGIKKQHQFSCVDESCFCRKTNDKIQFLKNFIMIHLQQIQQKDDRNMMILIEVLFFQLCFFNSYPKIFYKLNNFTFKNNANLFERYAEHELRQHVKKFIQRRNSQCKSIKSEQIFVLEQSVEQVSQTLRKQVEVRQKKWKYLLRGLCNTEQIKVFCQTEIDNIKRITQIYERYSEKFKKNVQFNLLLIFYFNKVAFLKIGKQLIKYLKQVFIGYRQDQIFHIKQFKKFIFHKQSSVIETLIGQKCMGNITACSKNISEVFGFSKESLMGCSIHKLMPQFMVIQHIKILSEWYETGTWKTIGKIKQIFCLHKDQYCFSAFLYLRIYIKNDSLHFITNIFKLNDNDYIVLNPQFNIEGIGRKFSRIIGENIKNIPIKLLMQGNSPQIAQRKISIQPKLYRKILYNIAQKGDQLKRFYDKFRMNRQENKNQIQTQFKEELMHDNPNKYLVDFTLKKFPIRNTHFFIGTLKEAWYLQKSQNYQNAIKSQGVIKNYNDQETFNFVVDCDMGQEVDFLSRNQNSNNQQLIPNQQNNSSIFSYTQKQHISLGKFYDYGLVQLMNNSKAKDPIIPRITAVFVTVVLALIVVHFMSFQIYTKGFTDITSLNEANYKTNDIVKLTEMNYNNLYLLKTLFDSQKITEFNSALQSLNLNQKYVYDLKQKTFFELSAKTSKLNDFKLFNYIEQQTQWISPNKQKTSISTYMFLQSMYYLSNQIIRELHQSVNSTHGYSSKVQLHISQMKDNFPQLQALNSFFINKYNEVVIQSHQYLQVLVIIFISAYSILIFSYGFIFFLYVRSRVQNVENIVKCLGFIENHQLDHLKEYYTEINKEIIEKKKLITIEQNYDQMNENHSLLNYQYPKNGRIKKSNKINFLKSQNSIMLLLIPLISCFFISFFVIETQYVKNFFPFSKELNNNLSKMMKEESHIIESYANLKGAYYINQNTSITQSFYNNLMVSMNQVDIQWIRMVNEVTLKLNQTDVEGYNIFLNILTENVCNVNNAQMNTFQINKCKNQLTLNIFDSGILSTFQFFQRTIRNSMEDFKQQHILKTDPVYNGDYFNQTVFIDMDNMLFYMFKVYQTTKQVTVDTFNRVVTTKSNNYQAFSFLISISYIIVLLAWLKSISWQLSRLAYLYGGILLIPMQILKGNPRMINYIKTKVYHNVDLD